MKTIHRIWFVALLTLVFPLLARADVVSPGDQIARFVGTTKGTGWGMPCMIIELHLPPDSSAITKIAVPNQDPMGKYDPNHVVVKNLEGAKPGDLLIVKTETDMGTTGIAKIGHYDAKPGEDEPNSFIFLEAKTDGDHPTVSLSRFGQVGVLPVATKRDDTGKMAPDTGVLDVVKDFKKGDVVIAHTKAGRPPMLTGIEAYTEPLKAQYVKLTSTTIDGQPHPAIDITTDSGNEAMIPLAGTANKAGKWTVDPDQYRAVRRLHAKEEIEYRTGGPSDQPVLKDITPGQSKPAGS